MSSKTSILIVIDMQVGFRTAGNNYTIRNVVKQIIKAKQLNLPIILVTYIGRGRIIPEISRSVVGYFNLHKIKKIDDDASGGVIRMCNRRKLNRQQFIICGVNAGWCVAETCEGLAEKNPGSKIIVLSTACNCYDRQRSIRMLRRIALKHNNLYVH